MEEVKNKEWIGRKLLADEDEKPILAGARQLEDERIKKGGVNYALYNLVMSIVSFKDCQSSLDANRKLYDGLYPYLNRLQKENLLMRSLLKDSTDPRIIELLKDEGDIQKMATEVLGQVTAAARKRSKENRYVKRVAKELLF